MRFTPLITAIALSFSAAQPALAKEPSSVRVSIPLAGIDLQSPSGMKQFRQRAVIAVREACERPQADAYQTVVGTTRCRKNAMEQAMRKAEAVRADSLALAAKP